MIALHESSDRMDGLKGVFIMRTSYRRVFLTLLLSLLAYASVLRAEGLYNISVPVASRSSDALEQALSEGLADVFTKVSGQVVLEDYPPLLEALSVASDYVQQYGYENTETQLLVEALFDSERVNALLIDAGLPIWSGYLPVNLLGLGVDIDGKRYIVTQNETQSTVASIRNQLTALASKRGMSLIFPVGDLQETREVTPSDIWGGFYKQIETASERYTSDGILIAKLSRSPQYTWKGQWQFNIHRQDVTGFTKDATLNHALNEVINSMVNVSASLYAPSQSAQEKIMMVVTGLDEIQAYAQVYAYLNQLKSVAQLRLVEFSMPNVVLDITLNGRLATFEKNISLEGMLIPDDATDNYIAQANTIIYRHMP